MRKYTSREKGDKDIYLVKLLLKIGEKYPNLSDCIKKLIDEIEIIEQDAMTSELSDGSSLSLRKTIELELYGAHLHSDINKLEQLDKIDPLLQYVTVRKYVEAYEKVLKKVYALIQGLDIKRYKNHPEERASILRITKTGDIEKNIKNSKYWSNLYGRDATEAELNDSLFTKDSESVYILALVKQFTEYLKQDVIDKDALRRFIHPATINAWDDFCDARNYIKSLKNIGMSDLVRYNERHDMAYVYLLENVTDGFLIQDYQIIGNAHVVTLAKDKKGEWRIYCIGAKLDDYRIQFKPIISFIEFLRKIKK